MENQVKLWCSSPSLCELKCRSISSEELYVRVDLNPFLGFPAAADMLPAVVPHVPVPMADVPQVLGWGCDPWQETLLWPGERMWDLRSIPGLSNPTHTKCFPLLKEEVGCLL